MANNFLLLFVFCLSTVQGAKILGIFPMMAKSHFICGNAVLKSLANAGHEITIATPFPKDAAKENYTSIINVSDGLNMYVSTSSVEEFSKWTIKETFEVVTNMELDLCEKVFNSKEIQDAFESKEKLFDIMVVELFTIQRCYYWIAQKLNIPVIGVVTERSLFGADWDLSNPRHAAFVPFELGKSANYKRFFNRLWNAFEMSRITYYWYTMIRHAHHQFYQKHVEGEISFEEFMSNKPSLMFVNGHSSYFPRPMNPNVIEIGGIHVKDERRLSKDLQEFLNEAEHGAILFTFGSVVKAARVPKHKIQAFKEAFAEIPQRVIWKYEEQLENLSSNVMLLNWLPQNNILAHKNVKAFISHCGQGAIHETLYHGVPLISCPLFSDQYLNADIFENLEIAVHLDYEAITKESVLKALHEIINNKKYYENMKTISKAFKDRPMTPQDTVVFWTDYVLRHKGAPNLKSPTGDLYWFQYFFLDVIIFVISLSFAILYIFHILLQYFYAVIVFHWNNTMKNKSD